PSTLLSGCILQIGVPVKTIVETQVRSRGASTPACRARHFVGHAPHMSGCMTAKWIALLLFCLPALPQTTYLPLKDVRPHQKGIGYTVFSGDKVEPFDVEILGILENAGPKQSIILGKLSGGPLAHTGVIQGMSGSPVYVDGKLIGAVAMAFSFSKDPIAGIRP